MLMTVSSSVSVSRTLLWIVAKVLGWKCSWWSPVACANGRLVAMRFPRILCVTVRDRFTSVIVVCSALFYEYGICMWHRTTLNSVCVAKKLRIGIRNSRSGRSKVLGCISRLSAYVTVSSAKMRRSVLVN